MTLGEKIQQLRKASGISQEQLADILNLWKILRFVMLKY